MRSWMSVVCCLIVIGMSGYVSAPQMLAEVESSAVRATVMPGFPVTTLSSGGTYQGGPAVNVTVGAFGADAYPDVLVPGLSNGPTYAWHHGGAPLSGWPVGQGRGAGYCSMGNLTSRITLQAFCGFMPDNSGFEAAYDSSGHRIFAHRGGNYVAFPAALGDVNRDGLDEIFVNEQDWKVHGYDGHGNPLPGWPVSIGDYQGAATPAIADIDGDGKPEIVVAGGSSSGGNHLWAFHADGSTVAGFPVTLSPSGTYSMAYTFPVVGDVDGDGKPEIVVVVSVGYPQPRQLWVISGNGTVKRSWPLTGNDPYGWAPALADINGDGKPEILIQDGGYPGATGYLEVFTGSGEPVPGFPVEVPRASEASPVVGDLEGKGQQDIVVVSKDSVYVYRPNGSELVKVTPQFGPEGTAAIAKLDSSGRNDLIVRASKKWDGQGGIEDTVWAYDFHGGRRNGGIDWGQLGGNPQHNGYYAPRTSAGTTG